MTFNLGSETSRIFKCAEQLRLILKLIIMILKMSFTKSLFVTTYFFKRVTFLNKMMTVESFSLLVTTFKKINKIASLKSQFLKRKIFILTYNMEKSLNY